MNKYQLLFLIIFLFLIVFMLFVNLTLKINRNRERIKFNIIKSHDLYTFNFEGIIFNKGCYPIYIDTIRITDKKSKEIKEQVPCYSYCILPKEKLSFNLNRYGMHSHIVEVITELGNSRKASLNI